MKKLTLAFTCLFLAVPYEAGTITVYDEETVDQCKVSILGHFPARLRYIFSTYPREPLTILEGQKNEKDSSH
jgi:hypothetical protein